MDRCRGKTKAGKRCKRPPWGRPRSIAQPIAIRPQPDRYRSRRRVSVGRGPDQKQVRGPD